MSVEAIFDPEDGKGMEVVGFFSGGASSLLAVLKKQRENETEGTYPFQVKIAFTDNPAASGIQSVAKYDVPIIVRDIEAYHASNGYPGIRDREKRKAMNSAIKDGIRRDYDGEAVDMFRDRLHLNIDETIDFGLLSGYMWKLTDVALGAFSVVVNIHPADLTRLGPDGKRIYTGDNAVYKAIKAGELETYSVAHVATKGVDEGPIIVRSRPLFVDETKRADDKAVLKDVAQVHQEKMKSHCDIPAFVKAVELTAAGLVGRNSDGALFYRSSLDSEWAAIPHGYQLGLEEQVMLAQTS